MSRHSIAAIAVALALAVLAGADRLAAHEIPTDVVVHAVLRPEGRRLQAVVRVPLRAMRDIDFPTRGPGFLDLSRSDAVLREAALQWVAGDLNPFEDDRPLGTPRLVAYRVSLPSDRSFASTDWHDAFAHVTADPLPADTELFWAEGMLDVLLEYPIAADHSRFALHPGFARLGMRVTTTVRFVTTEGTVRAFELPGDPGLVRMDPRWHQAATAFVADGFRHILDGPDHLLFLLCLVIPIRRFRELILVATAFTAAHSLTLIASAYGVRPDGLWFPPLVETAIAASIVYMALENIVAFASPDGDARDASAARVWRRSAVAFGFGLVHGFGFSFALSQTLQFAGSHLLTALLSFNIGVELGQILVIAAMVPALRVVTRVVGSERIAAVVLSALIAHTGWHWTVDRWTDLMQFGPPAVDARLVARALRWTMPVVAAGAAFWFYRAMREKRAGAASEPRGRSGEQGAPRASV